jgi:hypothetical protein
LRDRLAQLQHVKSPGTTSPCATSASAAPPYPPFPPYPPYPPVPPFPPFPPYPPNCGCGGPAPCGCSKCHQTEAKSAVVQKPDVPSSSSSSSNSSSSSSSSSGWLRGDVARPYLPASSSSSPLAPNDLR